MVSEIGRIRTISSIHHIDFVIAISGGSEGNLSSVGGPYRIFIERSMVSEIRRIGTIGSVHHIDFDIAIPVGTESNLSSVGGPVWTEIGCNVVR